MYQWQAECLTLPWRVLQGINLVFSAPTSQGINLVFSAPTSAGKTFVADNGLINRLLEEGRMSVLGVVVVDELYMIGDSHRGYLLELLVTKLLYVCRNNRVQSGPVQVGSDSEVVGGWNEVQIIGMSATLPNLDTLAEWLDAVLYSTHFRPVPLQEMVKTGSTLYDTDFKKIRELPSGADSSNDEQDIVAVGLCQETVMGGHSVLVFCPTKQWCETLARSI